jgi:hypothetical protein
MLSCQSPGSSRVAAEVDRITPAFARPGRAVLYELVIGGFSGERDNQAVAVPLRPDAAGTRAGAA